MGAIKALRAVIGVILCLVLAASLWLQRQAGDGKPFSLLGWELVPVREETMEPALAPGDVALVRPADSYQLGDTVLCREEAGPRLLRLVGSTQGQFIARGDGEPESAEFLLDPAAIEGGVWGALPGAAGLLDFLITPWGAGAVLLVTLLLLALPRLLGVPPRRSRHARRKP